MLAGELYDCGDAELLERWYKAKELQTEYNNTSPRLKEKLATILDQLIGQRGEDVWIAAPFFVDYGENIFLGKRVEINMNCTFLDCNRITIGDFSGIGPGVHIYTVYHPTNPDERLYRLCRELNFAFARGLFRYHKDNLQNTHWHRISQSLSMRRSAQSKCIFLLL